MVIITVLWHPAEGSVALNLWSTHFYQLNYNYCIQVFWACMVHQLKALFLSPGIAISILNNV